MRAITCRITGHRILEVEGQIVDLEAYLLGPSDEDLADSGVVGTVYARALSESGWAERWRACERRHLRSVVGCTELAAHAGYELFQNPRSRECFVLLPTGALVTLPASSQGSKTWRVLSEDTSGMALVVREEEHHLHGLEPSFAEALHATLRREGCVPLVDVVTGLGIPSALFDEAVLASSQFLPDRRFRLRPGSSSFSGRLRATIRLPASLVREAAAHARGSTTGARRR